MWNSILHYYARHWQEIPQGQFPDDIHMLPLVIMPTVPYDYNADPGSYRLKETPGGLVSMDLTKPVWSIGRNCCQLDLLSHTWEPQFGKIFIRALHHQWLIDSSVDGMIDLSQGDSAVEAWNSRVNVEPWPWSLLSGWQINWMAPRSKSRVSGLLTSRDCHLSVQWMTIWWDLLRFQSMVKWTSWCEWTSTKSR